MPPKENPTDCSAHSGVLQQLASLEESIRDLWAAVNHLRNRLPVWATFTMMGLSAAVGVLATLAAKA